MTSAGDRIRAGASRALIAWVGVGTLLLLAVGAVVVMMSVLVVLGGKQLADQQAACTPSLDPATLSADVPGSLGGMYGTGITRAEYNTVTHHPHAGPRLTAGRFLATEYGPPWGIQNGVDQGDGIGTAAGIHLNGGAPRKYMIAVDPAVINYGQWVYIWPNPFNWTGPFLAADTGGAINGRHVDIYDWRGHFTTLPNVQISSRPLRDRPPGPSPTTEQGDRSLANLPDSSAAPTTGTAAVNDATIDDTGGCDGGAGSMVVAGGPVGERIGQLAHRYLGRNARTQAFKDFQPPQTQLAWCAWFATNIWRLAGVQIPISWFSAAPYTWAQTRHQLYKPLGQPAAGPTPPLGSALMYGTGPASAESSQHVNLVTAVNTDGSFMLIGGNQGNSTVSQQGPCRLNPRTSRLTGPGCDPRLIYAIATPTPFRQA